MVVIHGIGARAAEALVAACNLVKLVQKRLSAFRCCTHANALQEDGVVAAASKGTDSSGVGRTLALLRSHHCEEVIVNFAREFAFVITGIPKASMFVDWMRNELGDLAQ